MSPDRPAVPVGLGPRGGGFWQAVIERFELAADEVELLLESCRTLDLIDALHGAVERDGVLLAGGRLHPGVNAARGQRAELRGLLSQLRLPHDEAAPARGGRSEAASKAARSRWAPGLSVLPGGGEHG